MSLPLTREKLNMLMRCFPDSPFKSRLAEEIVAYGQACRAAALEEAAQVCVQLADCEENTTNYRNGAAWCAEKIRSLK